MEPLAVGVAPAAGIIGCITGGTVVSIGRRRLMIILGVLFIVGIGFSLIGNYICFVIARIIKGLCMGYYTSLTPLYGLGFLSFIVREVSPPEIAGVLGSLFVLFVNFMLSIDSFGRFDFLFCKLATTFTIQSEDNR